MNVLLNLHYNKNEGHECSLLAPRTISISLSLTVMYISYLKHETEVWVFRVSHVTPVTKCQVNPRLYDSNIRSKNHHPKDIIMVSMTSTNRWTTSRLIIVEMKPSVTYLCFDRSVIHYMMYICFAHLTGGGGRILPPFPKPFFTNLVNKIPNLLEKTNEENNLYWHSTDVN